MQSQSVFSVLLVSGLVFSVVAQGSVYILNYSSPQNDSVIRLAADNEMVSCHFTSDSARRADGTIIRWFLNGEEIHFNKELESLQFPGIIFSVDDDGETGNVESTVTLQLVTSVAEDLLYLNDGNITCYPPGSPGGSVFAVFRTFLARNVTISWNESVKNVQEGAGTVKLFAFARGWTTDDSTLRVPLSLINGTATENEDYSGVPEALIFTEPSVYVDIQILDDTMHESNEYFGVKMNQPSTGDEFDIALTSTEVKIIIVSDDEATDESTDATDEPTDTNDTPTDTTDSPTDTTDAPTDTIDPPTDTTDSPTDTTTTPTDTTDGPTDTTDAPTDTTNSPTDTTTTPTDTTDAPTDTTNSPTDTTTTPTDTTDSPTDTTDSPTDTTDSPTDTTDSQTDTTDSPTDTTDSPTDTTDSQTDTTDLPTGTTDAQTDTTTTPTDTTTSRTDTTDIPTDSTNTSTDMPTNSNDVSQSTDTPDVLTELPLVNFEESSYTVMESERFVTVCLLKVNQTSESSTVNLTTIDGTSVAGKDYEALISLSLTLGTAGRGCMNITIVSDDIVEDPENFVVRGDLDEGSIATTINIIDSKACTNGQFYCDERKECLSAKVLCDCVINCYYEDGSTDESNCDRECKEVRPKYLSEREFIVEVYTNGSYYKVCRDTWDHREASVVCRQLNISDAGIITYAPQVSLGHSKLDVQFLDGIFCFGNETNLDDCLKIEDNACSSLQSVAVRCIDSDECNDGERRTVQVRDGNGGVEGRIEVCFNKLWGIASNSILVLQSLNVGTVICKDLGYEPAGAVYLHSARPHPEIPVLPIIWPVGIECDSATTFDSCSIEHLIEDLPSPPHASVAGFQCQAFSQENCTDRAVRLSEGLSFIHEQTSGLLEVCRNNTWNRLCGPHFTHSEANVACKQLGFREAGLFPTINSRPMFEYSPPLPVTTLSRVCHGNETHTQECTNLEPSPEKRLMVDPNLCYILIDCRGLPLLFLYSPSENLLDKDTYIVDEGRNFELTCSNGLYNLDDTFRLEHDDNGSLVKTDIGSVSIMQPITKSDAGNYTCSCVSSQNVTVVRHFRIIVNSGMGDSSTTVFRISVPSDESESIGQLILALISKDLEGVQEVTCSSVEESMRLEDVERQLSRVECVVSNYPPVDNFDVVVNSTIQILTRFSPTFAFLTTPGEGFCNAEMVNSISWPETRSGSEPVTVACPGNENRSVTRECKDATWSEADYSTCLSFSDIPTVGKNSVVMVLAILSSVVSGAPLNEQNKANAAIIADLLKQTAALLNREGIQLSTEDKIEIVNDVVEILDSLLEWDPEVVRERGSENVRNFESILVSLITSKDFNSQSIMEDDIALLARTVMAKMLADTGITLIVSSVNGQPNITGPAEAEGDQIAAVSFPSSIFSDPQVTQGQGPLAVAVAVYEEPAFFPLPEEDIGLETRVGTPVVSLLVARDREQIRIDNLNPPIVLNLSVTQIDVENVTNARCVFWDFATEEWSTDGCETQISDDSSQITCTCTHLTNFAALVDVCRRTEGCETSSEAEFALSVLSIVGVNLSLMGVVVTIFTMLFFKTLRKRHVSKFHIQLCIAIFCMLLVFLVGIQKTSVKGGCVTVSVLIHYFTLASVMWMGAEAVLMFQKLVLVFVRITTRYIVVVSIICWLAPLVPVIISVAIKPDHVIIKAEDDSPELCFIGNTATFFAAFLGPILAIVLFNCIIFVIVVIVLIRHKYRNKLSGLKTSASKSGGSTIRLMISMACIMSLFGLTWIFGALTVDKASLAFQIIFVILNSLQGFFIFLFLCVLGRDARELWLEFLFCGRYKSSYLHPSSVPISSTGKKAANVLLSINTGSTSAPMVEKSITSESGKCYVEDTKKKDLSKENDYVTTDIDDKSTPEPTAVSEGEGEGLSSKNHEDGSAPHNVIRSGHLMEKSGNPEQRNDHTYELMEELCVNKPCADNSSENNEAMDHYLSDNIRIRRYSTIKEGKHHVESFEVDFYDEIDAKV